MGIADDLEPQYKQKKKKWFAIYFSPCGLKFMVKFQKSVEMCPPLRVMLVYLKAMCAENEYWTVPRRC